MPPQALKELVSEPSRCGPAACHLASRVLYVATSLVLPEQPGAMEALSQAGVLAAVVELYVGTCECGQGVVCAAAGTVQGQLLMLWCSAVQ